MRPIVMDVHTSGVSLPQKASDETFKIPTTERAKLQTYGVAHPPTPQDNPQGLAPLRGTPEGAGVVPTCKTALKKDSWNNFIMSVITAGAFTGVSYGVDKFMSSSTPAVKAAEKKVESAEKILEQFEEKGASEKKVEQAEKKVEQAEKTLEKALEKKSDKALIKTSSKTTSLVVDGVSQLGISMGVRTAATCASATSETFQKNVKYITPFASGGIRGVVDYYLMGRNVGRTITDSLVVAGLEYASTGIVMGFK